MYKLLIVDDEPSVLEGLRSFDWTSLEIECIGVCSHGIEALKFMEENKPDILLTDIQMPIMSGLELIEKIKSNYPSIVPIILTGYAYFEYAHHGIKHGVCDYLLKPVNYDELKETFTSITKMLDKRFSEDQRLRLIQGKKQLLTAAIQKKFLKELLFGPMTIDEIVENAGLSEMTLSIGAYFSVAVMSLDKLNRNEITYSEKDTELILYAFDNILNEYFDGEPLGYFWIDTKACEVYFIFEFKSEDRDLIEQAFETIKSYVYKIRGLIKSTVSISVGSFKKNPTDILVSAEEARAVKRSIPHDESFVFYDSSAHMVDRDALDRASDNEDIEDKGTGDGDIEENISAKTSLHIINNAVQYINANYTRVLSLDEVANAVYTNASYLSYLFKQATGVNFINYLTKLRMKKARELLKDPKLKIQDISEAVGYESPRYFSLIFKKNVGMTPFKFRSQQND